jgi:hypothetical protein
MKILKKGNYFKAICTEDNEGDTRFIVGHSMGSISIKTEIFTGASACMLQLHEKLEEFKRRDFSDILNALEGRDVTIMDSTSFIIRVNGKLTASKKHGLVTIKKKNNEFSFLKSAITSITEVVSPPEIKTFRAVTIHSSYFDIICENWEV